MESRRRRVLQCIPDLSLGGAERMAVHLVRHLDPERFEVGLVSFYDPQGTDLDRTLAEGDHKVWYLGKKRGFDARMIPAIRRVVSEFRPDVIHTHTITLRYVLPVAKLLRVPARVHTIHNVASVEAGKWVWVRKLAFRSGFVPVAIADEVKRGVAELYGIDDAPNIPNGIPVVEYGEPNVPRDAWREKEGFAADDLLFVTIARLDPSKRQELAIQSVDAIASHPKARLLIVGEGHDDWLAGLKATVERLGAADKIRFLGRRMDIPDVLGACDLFTLSSDYEGNPLTVMEAMAAGLPVAATAVGGVPQLVEEGVTGLLCPPDDLAALSRAYETLAGDAALRARMGKAAQEQALARFDVSAMASAYAGLYSDLLGDTTGT